MKSYEQTLRLLERWCLERMNITRVDEVTESVIRHYIQDLQERGKYGKTITKVLHYHKDAYS